jgi:hypothetical protein
MPLLVLLSSLLKCQVNEVSAEALVDVAADLLAAHGLKESDIFSSFKRLVDVLKTVEGHNWWQRAAKFKASYFNNHRALEKIVEMDGQEGGVIMAALLNECADAPLEDVDEGDEIIALLNSAGGYFLTKSDERRADNTEMVSANEENLAGDDVIGLLNSSRGHFLTKGDENVLESDAEEAIDIFTDADLSALLFVESSATLHHTSSKACSSNDTDDVDKVDYVGEPLARIGQGDIAAGQSNFVEEIPCGSVERSAADTAPYMPMVMRRIEASGVTPLESAVIMWWHAQCYRSLDTWKISYQQTMKRRGLRMIFAFRTCLPKLGYSSLLRMLSHLDSASSTCSQLSAHAGAAMCDILKSRTYAAWKLVLHKAKHVKLGTSHHRFKSLHQGFKVWRCYTAKCTRSEANTRAADLALLRKCSAQTFHRLKKITHANIHQREEYIKAVHHQTGLTARAAIRHWEEQAHCKAVVAKHIFHCEEKLRITCSVRSTRIIRLNMRLWMARVGLRGVRSRKENLQVMQFSRDRLRHHMMMWQQTVTYSARKSRLAHGFFQSLRALPALCRWRRFAAQQSHVHHSCRDADVFRCLQLKSRAASCLRIWHGLICLIIDRHSEMEVRILLVSGVKRWVNFCVKRSRTRFREENQLVWVRLKMKAWHKQRGMRHFLAKMCVKRHQRMLLCSSDERLAHFRLLFGLRGLRRYSQDSIYKGTLMGLAVGHHSKVLHSCAFSRLRLHVHQRQCASLLRCDPETVLQSVSLLQCARAMVLWRTRLKKARRSATMEASGNIWRKCRYLKSLQVRALAVRQLRCLRRLRACFHVMKRHADQSDMRREAALKIFVAEKTAKLLRSHWMRRLISGRANMVAERYERLRGLDKGIAALHTFIIKRQHQRTQMAKLGEIGLELVHSDRMRMLHTLDKLAANARSALKNRRHLCFTRWRAASLTRRQRLYASTELFQRSLAFVASHSTRSALRSWHDQHVKVLKRRYDRQERYFSLWKASWRSAKRRGRQAIAFRYTKERQSLQSFWGAWCRGVVVVRRFRKKIISLSLARWKLRSKVIAHHRGTLSCMGRFRVLRNLQVWASLPCKASQREILQLELHSRAKRHADQQHLRHFRQKMAESRLARVAFKWWKWVSLQRRANRKFQQIMLKSGLMQWRAMVRIRRFLKRTYIRNWQAFTRMKKSARRSSSEVAQSSRASCFHHWQAIAFYQHRLRSLGFARLLVVLKDRKLAILSLERRIVGAWYQHCQTARQLRNQLEVQHTRKLRLAALHRHDSRRRARRAVHTWRHNANVQGALVANHFLRKGGRVAIRKWVRAVRRKTRTILETPEADKFYSFASDLFAPHDISALSVISRHSFSADYHDKSNRRKSSSGVWN